MPLYVLGTPIGNLGDLTERGREILRKAEIIVCESRERALKLIRYVGANPRRIIKVPAPEERKKAGKIAQIIADELLSDKEKVAVLIVGAGTPAISDPGAIFVEECRKRGVDVLPLPGPSAFVSAISVSGIDSSRVLFLAFPPKKGKRSFWKKVKEGVEKLPFKTSIAFYESPHRITETLNTIQEVFGDETEVFLAREMTKLHEEYIKGKIKEVIEKLKSKERIKGEITVIILPVFSPSQPSLQ